MESDYTLINLIILTIIMFIRSVIHALFDNNLLDIDSSNKELDVKVGNFLAVMAMLRVFVIILILISRKGKFDLITCILYFLMFTGVLRIYYQYLEIFNSQSPIYIYFNKYEDIDSLIIFLFTGYMIKYIFF